MFPLVTIAITTYNRFSFVKNSILSAVSQSYNNIEILVIEDGSNSGILEWIKEQNDKKQSTHN